jgi:hypothetical protein
MCNADDMPFICLKAGRVGPVTLGVLVDINIKCLISKGGKFR